MAQLAGLIMTSPNPARLADFYRGHFDIPYQLNQHGALPPHYECDHKGIHYAILDGPEASCPGSVTPSFQVENLDTALSVFEHEGIKPLHAIIELGGGPRVCTIADPDGNHVRLFAWR